MKTQTIRYIPYTYLISWTKHRKSYYGVQYANNRQKTANPKNLWTTYFTSSKKVKEFREKYGEPDLIQIRRTFDSSEEALAWESKVLRRLGVRRRVDMLNTHEGGKSFSGSPKGIGTFNKGMQTWHCPETRAKKFVFQGVSPPDGFILGGPPLTSDQLSKMLATKKARGVYSEESMENMREGQRLWVLKHLGGNHPQAKPVTIDGVDYTCINDAAAALRVSRPTIRAYLKRDIRST